MRPGLRRRVPSFPSSASGTTLGLPQARVAIVPAACLGLSRQWEAKEHADTRESCDSENKRLDALD